MFVSTSQLCSWGNGPVLSYMHAILRVTKHCGSICWSRPIKKPLKEYSWEHASWIVISLMLRQCTGEEKGRRSNKHLPEFVSRKIKIDTDGCMVLFILIALSHKWCNTLILWHKWVVPSVECSSVPLSCPSLGHFWGDLVGALLSPQSGGPDPHVQGLPRAQRGHDEDRTPPPLLQHQWRLRGEQKVSVRPCWEIIIRWILLRFLLSVVFLRSGWYF